MTPRTGRRLWDSCVVIGYPAGYPALEWVCSQIIQQGERGNLEIIVSEMAKVEVAYLSGHSDSESEAMIREFFSRDYVIPVSVDDPVSTLARNLIRKYRNEIRIEPADAIHLATAIQWSIPVIETTDDRLLRFDGREGSPAIRVRTPVYEGAEDFPNF